MLLQAGGLAQLTSGRLALTSRGQPRWVQIF
jgi:hypothetical protein